MHQSTRNFALAVVLLAIMAVPATLHAHSTRGWSNSMSGGMIDNMRGRMSRKMTHCGGMMQGDRRGDRPNDQWRNGAPATPDEGN